MKLKTRRWAQLAFLVEFVREWKAMPSETRDAALKDPWVFKAVVTSAPGPAEPSQRAALLYLASPRRHPDVSTSHKKLIIKAFPDELPSPTNDLDRDVLAIKQALEQQGGPAVADFYKSPWVERWRPGHGPDDTADEETAGTRTWLIRGSAVWDSMWSPNG